MTPDGYRGRAALWVELERRKCDDGMRAYLMEVRGTVCGTVAAVEVDGVLRAKNILINPAWRREGIGTEVMHLLSMEAEDLGKSGVGIFGIDGEPGDSLYRALGMTPVAHLTEWAKGLGVQRPGWPSW